MNTLTLKNQRFTGSTMIENHFIDTYMVKANGEFVKVYLFLLRHINNTFSELSIPTIADSLEHTENDILRALKYWESAGILAIEYDKEKRITGLELRAVSSPPSSPALQEPQPVPEVQVFTSCSAAADTEAAHEPPPEPVKIDTFKNQKELKQLLFVAEQYLGKTLTKSDMDMIYDFHGTLGFSSELVEYLIEYCVEHGHKSMHYIRSVALAWSDSGIATIDEAKAASAIYNKDCYAVLKAFGISGRGPVSNEKNYIEKWTAEYGFTLDIILEACDRTMTSIHQPSFDYTDSILSNWSVNGVHHLAEIHALDLAYKKEKADKKKTAAKPIANNKFNNFKGRSYDIHSLEDQLLNTK